MSMTPYKIVQINATCGIGSTGKICVGISQALADVNVENYTVCSRSNGYELGIPCSSRLYIRTQALNSRIFGNYGFQSYRATKKMLRELDRIRPDIVHLHNIHGHDCNLAMLFKYFKKNNTKLIWTFHDCWSFTAYCPYFTRVQCDKWKNGCEHCPQYRDHSFWFDRSKELYRKKKELFSGLNLTIVTPSQWLADLVKQSFLKEYPVNVIYNGINLSVFHPTKNSFREKYGIPPNKHILLGVAFDWGVRKGMDVFFELANHLDPDHYQIVMVGTNDTIDKRMPRNIISIHRTQNQQELAEIYSAADLFVNPTREEVLGLVNLEALACGTPVLTFCTGGSPECIDDTCGAVVPCDDIDALEKEIIRICSDPPFSAEACIKRASEFDQNTKYKEYVALYESIFEKSNEL